MSQKLQNTAALPTMFRMSGHSSEIAIVAVKDALVLDLNAQTKNSIGRPYRSHATVQLLIADAQRLQALLTDAITSAVEIGR